MTGTRVGAYATGKPEPKDEPTVYVPDDKSVTVTMTFCRPEHEDELREALNASRFNSVLWNLDQFLRSEVKHGDDEVKGTHYQQVRDKLWSLLEDEGLSLE
jgi:hypothetical protein